MRGARRILLAAILIAAAQTASAQTFKDSAFRMPIPEAPCDVTITPANAATTLFLFDDVRYRVFCFAPGDYRGIRRRFVLNASGTASQRRYLRFASYDGRHAVEREDRAIAEAVHIFGSWWVVQGLTVLPTDPDTEDYVGIYGGDNNIIDGNVVDGIHHPNVYEPAGIAIQAYYGNAASFNTVQRNVVRNGDQARNGLDSEGIVVREGFWPNEDNSYNRVVDNEVVDWGNGATVSGHRDDCAEAGVQRGTILDNNDIYLTAAKRANCATGGLDPNGACACAEHGIDVKAEPGPLAANWTRVTNNRIWGYRPTPVVRCGGSGAGQAMTAGNACPGHVLVANNIVQDSSVGLIAAGRDWIIAGNVFHDIHVSSGRPAYGQLAIWPSPSVDNVLIQFNTIVGVDDAYVDTGSNVDTRCNVVVDNAAVATKSGGVRGPNHVTAYNYLYASPRGRFLGGTNAIYSTAQQSGNTQHCFWRRRWTGAERVCIPYAATTAASPHLQATANCNEDLLAGFGIPVVGFPRPVSRCGLGAELVLVLPLLGLLRRRRSH